MKSAEVKVANSLPRIKPLLPVQSDKEKRKWEKSPLDARQCPVSASRSAPAPELGETSGFKRQKTNDGEWDIGQIEINDTFGKGDNQRISERERVGLVQYPYAAIKAFPPTAGYYTNYQPNSNFESCFSGNSANPPPVPPPAESLINLKVLPPFPPTTSRLSPLAAHRCTSSVILTPSGRSLVGHVAGQLKKPKLYDPQIRSTVARLVGRKQEDTVDNCVAALSLLMRSIKKGTER